MGFDDEDAALAHQQELEQQEQIMDNTDNMAFWTAAMKTDPARVKPITGKQYKGNSPQPYYLVERMTESFGMCGIGWGLTIISERMERLTETDVLHVALIELWYIQGGKTGRIQQVGQTKAAYQSSKGSMVIDEDAPKKSITDAMTKCMSYLGFAGDIFSGMWDDSKYVEEIRGEFDSARYAKQRAEAIKTACENIATADSLSALKAAFASWYTHFGDDEDAIAQITAAKDGRKAQLEIPQKEAA